MRTFSLPAAAVAAAVAAVVLAIGAAPAAAFGGGSPFSRSGTILAANGASTAALDACNVVRPFPPGVTLVPTYDLDASPQEGLDSACFDLPADAGGRQFFLAATDATGLAGEGYGVRACFYFADHTFWGCVADGRVPIGAARASIIATAGVDLRWTFDMP